LRSCPVHFSDFTREFAKVHQLVIIIFVFSFDNYGNNDEVFLELGMVYACGLPLCLAGYKQMPSWAPPSLYYVSLVIFFSFFLSFFGGFLSWLDHHEEGRSSKWVFIFFNFDLIGPLKIP
jgi:hypothetical protein